MVKIFSPKESGYNGKHSYVPDTFEQVTILFIRIPDAQWTLI